MNAEAVAVHHFTVEDYYRLGDAGVLAPDVRVELLDGQIYDMLPIGPFHSGVESRLRAIFTRQAKDRWMMRNQNPVRLNGDSEPLPDIALVKPREDHYSRSHPVPADVFLLVEIAQSSLTFDRNAKLSAYARAAIAEYWIVNLRAKSLEIFLGPLPGGDFRTKSSHKVGETVNIAAFPDVLIDISDLF